MFKIISKMLISVVLITQFSVQATDSHVFWQQYRGSILSSLYVLGAAGITYLCYKDVSPRVKRYTIPLAQLDKEKKKSKKREEEIAAVKQKIANQARKPIEVGAFFIVAGVALWFYNAC